MYKESLGIYRIDQNEPIKENSTKLKVTVKTLCFRTHKKKIQNCALAYTQTESNVSCVISFQTGLHKNKYNRKDLWKLTSKKSEDRKIAVPQNGWGWKGPLSGNCQIHPSAWSQNSYSSLPWTTSVRFWVKLSLILQSVGVPLTGSTDGYLMYQAFLPFLCYLQIAEGAFSPLIQVIKENVN